MSKVNIQFYKPFGSSISLQDLPPELIKDFTDDLDMIMKLPEDKKKIIVLDINLPVVWVVTENF